MDWLQLVFNKDNVIDDQDSDMKIEMFWKDCIFTCCQIDHIERPVLWFESKTYDGPIMVTLVKSVSNAGMYYVSQIEHGSPNGDRITKSYSYTDDFIQVLHKRNA